MLTVDSPLRPASHGPEELVPSRYALKVGDIDVMVVSDGVLPLPAATMATNADPAELADWLDHMFLPPDKFDWPLNVLAVRSGDQTILVDAGVGTQFPGFPRAGQFPARLEAVGFLRVHRSAIVNLALVKAVVPRRSGDRVVVLRDGTRLRVGRLYSARLLQRTG